MLLYCTKLDGTDAVITTGDVCYIDLWRKNSFSKHTKIRFNTRKGEYLFRLNGSLETAIDQFEQFGFYPLDVVNVVNLNNIVYIDDDKKHAYFDSNLHTTIADGKMDIVKHFPRRS
jgi:hypothetical protein